MDSCYYRPNFDLRMNNEICQHSWREHLKIPKSEKFACEMFWNTENI